MTRNNVFCAVLFAACATFGAAVRAENVDLSTVPARNTVQLTIYNSEDLTLVRETRKVTFKPGPNPLQIELGQYAHRPNVSGTAVPHAWRKVDRARHDLPPRQAADAVLERAK